MKLIIDTSCFACTDENKKVSNDQNLAPNANDYEVMYYTFRFVGKVFHWNFLCWLRVIIRVQSFIIKCLSFHRVSFFQGYSLCIEKLCTRIILAMLITERIHFDQFDPKILSLWKNEMVTERGKYIHRYISKLLYIYIWDL